MDYRNLNYNDLSPAEKYAYDKGHIGGSCSSENSALAEAEIKAFDAGMEFKEKLDNKYMNQSLIRQMNSYKARRVSNVAELQEMFMTCQNLQTLILHELMSRIEK